MRASKSNRMKNHLTNKVIEQRRLLESRVSDRMDLEKAIRYRKIKEEYYSRNPDALRNVLPTNLEIGGIKGE